MANCHSIPYSQPPSNDNARALSSNARLTNFIPIQSRRASRHKNKKRQQRYKYNGLSATDILLYYLQTQTNYRLSDHQFYPNIVIYYNETQANCIPNTQNDDMESTSEIKNSSILDENADPNQYPYNCLGIITGKDSSSLNATNKVGTGCLVSPSLVLTSASLVTQQKTGLLLKNLAFFPKACANSKSQQGIRIIDVKLPSGYFRTHNDSSQDYALLLLEHSIKRQKYIYIGYDMSKESKAQLYGYQLGLIQLKLQQQTYKQLGIKGKILQIQDQKFLHSIPTRKTCTGAPIIVEYMPGFIFTVGIFSNHQHKHSACRITANKVHNLKKWAKDMTGKEFNITTVKMVDFAMKKIEIPKGFTTLTHQIAQMQQLVDFQHQNGPTDQLRFYLGKLGQLCWKNGEFNRSIINLQQGLRICNELYKPQSQQSSFFFSNLGLNYQRLKQYDKAFRNFQLALKINKRKGERTLGVAIAYNNIGNIYKKKGKYQKALECFNLSLEIKRKFCGQRSEGVAASLSNIALLEWQKKNYQQAIKVYKDSLSIYRQVFGQSHFQISRTLYNLALCYYDTQQYQQWLDLHYQSLSIMQILKMGQHPSYSKRKDVLITNLLAAIQHPNCSCQLVLKSIKIVSTLFSNEQAKEVTHELQLKIASFK